MIVRESNKGLFPIWIFLIALALSLFFLFFLEHPTPNGYEYANIARNIASGNGYVSGGFSSIE